MDPTLAKAVIKVGDGRGFIILHSMEVASFRGERCFQDERLVVTASHCLPHLPPRHPASFSYERTYNDLLGPLDDPKPHISAACLFADPVTDIAVLGRPDNYALCE